jgi:outer membrane protein TolC
LQAISHRSLQIIAVLLLSAAPVMAQDPLSLPRNSPFNGGVPSGTATNEPIKLTIIDAVVRGLQHNLGVLLAEQNTNERDGDRLIALSRLLPNITGSVTDSRRKTNLEAFGFPLGPNFPRVVGPYSVFDARVFLSQSVFDRDASYEASAASHRLEAAKHSYRGARSLVMLASANLYLQALAAQARSQAAQAQLTSSQAIHQQAIDLRQSGIIAGLDVVRAEVRLSSDRQRATAAANDAQKAKLQLAHVIGLPIGQEFTMSEDVPMIPDPTLTLQQALDSAYAHRDDYLAAIEQQKAAEASKKAAAADRLPSVRVVADYGTIGLTPGTALPTFNVTGAVDVPIFEGGRQRGRLAQAEAELKRRTAELESLKAAVYYDVRTSFLDVEAQRQQAETATRGRQLAEQQLQQSRDRFAAGVASNIEVLQAQEAVALATEQAISAQYGLAVAKALLAESTGSAEETLMNIVKGSNQ